MIEGDMEKRFRRNKVLPIKLALLLLMVVLLVAFGSLSGLGCIRGLQAIGWSGGAVVDNTLFVGSKEGRLVAINLADGGRQWSEALKMSGQGAGLFGCAAPAAGGGCGGGPTGVAIYGTPAVAGGLVYVAGYNGKIYAFDAGNLQIRWIYPREGNLQPIVGGTAVAQDMVYVSAADTKESWKLYALDAATGNEIWQFEAGDKIWSTPVVSGGMVYFGSFDHKLYALDSGSGNESWQFEAEGAIAATPLVFNGTVYIGSFDRHIYAVDAASGNLKWQFMGENWFWATPVVYEGVVYVPCLDGRVYALDAESGLKLEEYDLGSPISSSPVMVDSTVVLASQEGVIYAIDTGSGQLRQLVGVGIEVYGPLSTSQGVVYFYNQEVKIHAVDASTGAELPVISLKSGE
jgi:outer membrane protein assembly factor BamB